MRTLLFLIILSLSSCVSREEVEATIFLNNFNTEELKGACEREPILNQIGFYRKLNNGKIEFLSICKDEAHDFFSIYKDDFQRILDKALPKKQESLD